VLVVPDLVLGLVLSRAAADLAAAALQAVYLIGFLAARGRTLGNLAAGTRVVAESGQPLTLARAAGRWLAQAAFELPGAVILILDPGNGLGLLLPALALVDDLWPLWDPLRQTLHDKLAGTLVLAVG
jgi:uncharacterized RDD family membrane protein YckC